MRESLKRKLHTVLGQHGAPPTMVHAVNEVLDDPEFDEMPQFERDESGNVVTEDVDDEMEAPPKQAPKIRQKRRKKR